MFSSGLLTHFCEETLGLGSPSAGCYCLCVDGLSFLVHVLATLNMCFDFQYFDAEFCNLIADSR